LAVNIALDDYINLIQGMRFILVRIRRIIERHQSPGSNILDICLNEVDGLQKITDELEADLESISKLLLEEIPIKKLKIEASQTTRTD
jgi:hypothetical protein